MKSKRKITVSDLRGYEFCSVSWCIARDLGEHTRRVDSRAEKSRLRKDNKLAKRAQSRGQTAHWLYDFKRGVGIVIFFALCALALWILLTTI